MAGNTAQSLNIGPNISKGLVQSTNRYKPLEIEDTSDEDRQEPASRKQYEKKGHPRVSKTKANGTEVNQEATSNSDKSHTVVIIDPLHMTSHRR